MKGVNIFCLRLFLLKIKLVRRVLKNRAFQLAHFVLYYKETIERGNGLGLAGH
jgi:hypothetical protein